jgi:hypothetical protein
VLAPSETYLNYVTITDDVPSVVAPSGKPNYYPHYSEVLGSVYKYKLSKVEESKGKAALLANAFASYTENPFDAKLSGHFLNVNKGFESELAASPAYLPNLPILNSGVDFKYGLEQFRSSSLENMYYSLYYTLPLNVITIINGQQGNPESLIGSRGTSFSKMETLDNNYKFAHYYRNAYTQQTWTRLERSGFSFLDPSVNMALPYGFATPDRKGGGADLNFTWNKAVKLNGIFGIYSSEYADYTRFGGGLEVDFARLAGLGKALTISGSYEQNKEEKGFWNPQTDRIMAGFKIGIWRGISLLGGFQQLTKEFKNPYALADDFAINKTNEILTIGGPQIKISEKANFTLQGGKLSNSVSFTAAGIKDVLDLNKFIMSGMVTVVF